VLAWILAGLMLSLPLEAEVLAVVDATPITSRQLQQALSSSPFATQYLALDPEAQAALRRDLLQRLVQAEVLYQEARKLGLERDERVRQDVADFETGLLAQKYLQFLRDSIKVPEEVQAEWRLRLRDDHDALAAVQALYVARRYQAEKAKALARLRGRYGDLSEADLLARGAREAGIQVSEQVAGFRRERLIQRLLEIKEREWVPDEAVLRAYYWRHPEIGRVPEYRHIGQIVVADRKTAEALRRRILTGESLFRLAEEYSLDPYGKEHAGDMGWLPEGSAMPEIEAALAQLADGEVSEVIETSRGFHLVTVVERKPGEQKPFAAVADRVRQALLSEHQAAYLHELMARHSVRWLADNQDVQFAPGSL
jgi:peptidyl-prolyl cis-trans isomerase C